MGLAPSPSHNGPQQPLCPSAQLPTTAPSLLPLAVLLLLLLVLLPLPLLGGSCLWEDKPPY